MNFLKKLFLLMILNNFKIILYIMLGVNVSIKPYPPFFVIRPQVADNSLISSQQPFPGYHAPRPLTTCSASRQRLIRYC